MSNDARPNKGDDGAGVPPPAVPDTSPPGFPVLEDIGWGYAQVQPPATLDDIPFPSDDPSQLADYDWAQNDPEVCARHGGMVVAVRHRKVWGVGWTYQQAWEDASRKPDCPGELVYVYVWPTLPREADGRHSG
jgi:hypothetical protein